MISVVFPTRNRAELLNAALRSVSEQSIDPAQFEVLVIDNGSTDNTREISQHWKAWISNIRYFYEAEPGLHSARHRGLVEAKGEILVFADDDIEAQPLWLQTFADLFSDPDVAMAGGNTVPLFLESPPPWLEALWTRRARNGVRSLPALSIQEYPHGRYSANPSQIWGCNFAIRKSVLLSAGGFHPDGMPSELIRFRGDGETHVSSYVQKNGLKCLFDSNASVYHKVTPDRMTLSYFYQRGFRQGVSDSYTWLRNNSPKSTFIRSVAFRILTYLLRRMKYLYLRSHVERETHRVLEAQWTGYYQGYAFHQSAYRENPDVVAWVHQENYF